MSSITLKRYQVAIQHLEQEQQSSIFASVTNVKISSNFVTFEVDLSSIGDRFGVIIEEPQLEYCRYYPTPEFYGQVVSFNASTGFTRVRFELDLTEDHQSDIRKSDRRAWEFRPFNFQAQIRRLADSFSEDEYQGCYERLLHRMTSKSDVGNASFHDPELNPEQNLAVRAGLAGDTLIWGPPGTGKTRTLAAMLVALAERGRRVLVVAPTNKAVDVIALQVADSLERRGLPREPGKFLRVGAPVDRRMFQPEYRFLIKHEDMREAVYERLGSINRELEMEERRKEGANRSILMDSDEVDRIESKIQQLINEKQKLEKELADLLETLVAQASVTFVTNFSSLGKSEITTFMPDVLVIDEAGMLGFPYAMSYEKVFGKASWVVAGDFNQLAPFALKNINDKEPIETTYFDLYGMNPKTNIQAIKATEKLQILKKQYRMIPEIGEFISKNFYSGLLIHAKKTGGIARRPFSTNGFKRVTATAAPGKAFDELILRTYSGLREIHPQQSFMIMSPWNMHLKCINQRLSAAGLPKIATTVHRAQGDEADIVLWIDTPPNGILGDNIWSRRVVNTALSRGKELVITVSANHTPPVASFHKGLYEQSEFLESEFLAQNFLA